MLRAQVCSFGLVALLLFSAAPVHAQPSPGDREQARALFAAGQAAIDAGRWTDALDAFQRAYELSHLPVTLFNAAFALRALGRYEDAAAAYEALLAQDHVPHPMVVEARGYLEEVRARIASITLEGLPDDAITTIHLDAEGVADDGTRPLRLSTDPGHHAIDVSLTGHQRFEWAGELANGQALQLAVSLPISLDGPGTSRPTEIYEEAWFWVVMGVVVVGAAAGIIGGVIADQQAQFRGADGAIATWTL